jgi:hypothetical protein
MAVQRRHRRQRAPIGSASLCVGGGENPRINGAWPKTGTKLAVEPMVATMLAG